MTNLHGYWPNRYIDGLCNTLTVNFAAKGKCQKSFVCVQETEQHPKGVKSCLQNPPLPRVRILTEFTRINPEMLRIVIMQMYLFPSRVFLRFAGCTTDTLPTWVLSGFGSKVVTKHFNSSLIDDPILSERDFPFASVPAFCPFTKCYFAIVLGFFLFGFCLGVFFCNEEDGMVTDKTQYDFS